MSLSYVWREAHWLWLRHLHLLRLPEKAICPSDPQLSDHTRSPSSSSPGTVSPVKFISSLLRNTFPLLGAQENVTEAHKIWGQRRHVHSPQTNIPPENHRKTHDEILKCKNRQIHHYYQIKEKYFTIIPMRAENTFGKIQHLLTLQKRDSTSKG